MRCRFDAMRHFDADAADADADISLMLLLMLPMMPLPAIFAMMLLPPLIDALLSMLLDAADAAMLR